MTMNPFGAPMGAGPMGPQAGGPMGGQQGVSVEDAFVDGFSQMAYDAMQKSNPSLMKDVITFRVLDTDPEEGSGLGTFILAVNREVFYVPVVVTDNQIKPIDMFYSRRLDRYFPLSPEWIQEANRSALTEMGQGIDPPKTLQTDVDIRNVVLPPLAGRFAYASLAKEASAGRLDRDARLAFASAARYTGADKKAAIFPEMLAAMPDQVKVAFAKALATRPRLLRKMAALYTVNGVREALALRGEKTAQQTERPMKHDVFVATMMTPVTEMQSELGSDTSKAYGAVRTFGFYAKDRRLRTEGAYQIDPDSIELTVPKQSGLYRVFTPEGEVEEVIVLVGTPVDVCCPEPSGISKLNAKPDDRAPQCVVLYRDGRIEERKATFVAEPVMTSNQGELTALVHARTSASAMSGQRGVWVSTARGAPRFYGPVTINKVVSHGRETRYETDWGKTVLVSEGLAKGVLLNPPGSQIATLAGDYRWFSGDKSSWSRPSVLCQTAGDVFRAIEMKLLRSGSKKIEVKTASGRFLVAGERLGTGPALAKVAQHYGVSLPIAATILTDAALGLPTVFWTKRAADDGAKKKPAPKDSGPPEQEDPSADPMGGMPMDPSMMGPPMPDGYELAIAEQLQLIQNQVAALNDKATTLSMLQQRKLEIDGGGGPMAAPTGAASLLAGIPAQGPGGMPAMAPPGAQPGMPPGQGDPMSQGAPPAPPPGMPGDASAMAPATASMGQPQGGAMAAGPGVMPMPPMGPPGGPMQAMQLPPRPVMTEHSLDSGSLDNAINPDFLDQAGSLEQSDVFDAASIASLAQNRNLRSVVQSHLPRAEETLDNLGRMKLLFDLRESKLKQSIGNDAYNDLSQTIGDVFQQLGDLLLQLNQSSDQMLPQAMR